MVDDSEIDEDQARLLLLQRKHPLFDPEFRTAFAQKAADLKTRTSSERHCEAVWLDDDMRALIFERYMTHVMPTHATIDSHFQVTFPDGKSGQLNDIVYDFFVKAVPAFYSDKIRQASSSEILSLYEKYYAEKLVEDKEKAIAQDERLFFNYPQARNISLDWAFNDALTPEEAAALVLGREPSVVNKGTLAKITERNKSLFCKDFDSILLLIERAIYAKKLANPLTLTELYLWSEKNQISPAYEISSLIKQRNDSVESPGVEAYLQPRGKELNSLYALVLFFAKTYYRFDTAKENEEEQEGVYAAIERDMHKAKLPLSSKTIRRHVRAAQAYAVRSGLIAAPRVDFSNKGMFPPS